MKDHWNPKGQSVSGTAESEGPSDHTIEHQFVRQLETDTFVGFETP